MSTDNSTDSNKHSSGFTKELLELALKSSGDSVWFWNIESGELVFDRNWIKHLGYKPSLFKLTFEWWDNNIKPEHKPVFETAFNDYLEGHKDNFEIEYQIRTNTGDWIWVWAIGKCIEYGNDGKPLIFIGTHRDITRIKNNESTLTSLTNDLEQKVLERTQELENALHEIKTLQGIIPICGYCKKIRDDQGSWNQLEKYICEHSNAAFSHGVCPDCYKKVINDNSKPNK